MATQQFKLADIGEGITEVTVAEWFVKEGDTVKEMDNVCMVESDKASVELSSPYSGKVVKIHHQKNSVVKVGSVLIDVETAAPAAAPPTPAAAKAKPPTAAVVAPASAGIQTFTLADIGEGIAEVQLTEWFVKEGDVVKEMDRLCSVESDKASVELTSPYSGQVAKLYHKVSDTVKVGAPLVDITGGPAATTAAAPAATAAVPAAAAPTGPTLQAFKLADIGEGIASVQLTEWFVKEGDSVKEMDNLCSVESDKASVELTSPFTGKVKKIHYQANDTVKVGAVLVEIETVGGAAPSAAAPPAKAAATATPAAAAPAKAAAPAAPASAGAKAPGVLATPKVRHIAKEKGIDLNTVTGTGAMGRVLEQDVLAAASAVAAPKAAPEKADKAAPAAAPTPARPLWVPGEDKVMEITDAVGKGMVKSMTEALKVPIMALGEEIDMTAMLTLQKSLKEKAEKKYGTKVTVTSFMIKAISLALAEHPKINSKFGPDGANPPYYTVFGSHNVSVAVDTPFGLVVPNIKGVENLTVMEIQKELQRIAADAMANKLKLSDIQGGTITLSNIGVIGTKDPRPIPFAGQAVIGATGRTMLLPRYNEKMELVPRQIMNVRWVGDHRHLDGAGLARFSNSFKRYMEDPGEWTLALR